ncbi:DNAJC11 domain-containing protein [Chloroflexota bacterium]
MSNNIKVDNAGWKYTTSTATALAFIGIFIWFLSTLTYEPLIALIPVTLGILVARYNTRWQVDIIVSASLIILFFGGIILIQISTSPEQFQTMKFNNSELWLLLVAVISAIILISIILVLVLKRNNRLSKIFLWALVGKTDTGAASLFLECLFKIFVSSILWAVITALLFIIGLLLLIIASLALGSTVSGTAESLMAFGVLGAILGFLLGSIIAIIRIASKFKNRLIIISAKYGANNGWMDIAPLLKTKIHYGKLQIRAKNSELGGDPTPGVFKQLEVTYSFNGEINTLAVSETEMLTLPPP